MDDVLLQIHVTPRESEQFRTATAEVEEQNIGEVIALALARLQELFLVFRWEDRRLPPRLGIWARFLREILPHEVFSDSLLEYGNNHLPEADHHVVREFPIGGSFARRVLPVELSISQVLLQVPCADVGKLHIREACAINVVSQERFRRDLGDGSLPRFAVRRVPVPRIFSKYQVASFPFMQ